MQFFTLYFGKIKFANLDAHVKIFIEFLNFKNVKLNDTQIIKLSL